MLNTHLDNHPTKSSVGTLATLEESKFEILPEDKTQLGLSFEELGLAKPILAALAKVGYTHPTPIQAEAIPPSLVGSDLLLSAQTGSGKTAAFVLPILHRLANNRSEKGDTKVRAVILTPTRELALQVQESVRTYGSRLKGIFSVPLVGGAAYGGQIRALRKGVQIIVATPGRFIDHLNAGRIDLSSLDVLVLDEADRMLDMGFSEDIDTILAAAPSKRQTIMSSATWDGAVGKIAETFTTNPKRVSIKVESAHIDESVYFCDDFHHKNNILYQVLNKDDIGQAVIFTATKMSSERLATELTNKGYSARYLHGDLPQAKRNRIVSDVKAGKVKFLIATDVAARGIDIASISHVVNYDLPRQAEDYVHRIGRCGRAGRTGVAINLCSRDDRTLFSAINRYLNRTMRTEVIVGLEPKIAFEERKNKGGHGKGRKARANGRGARFTDDRFSERSYRDVKSSFKKDRPKSDDAKQAGFGQSNTKKEGFKSEGFGQDVFIKSKKPSHKPRSVSTKISPAKKEWAGSSERFKKDNTPKAGKAQKSTKNSRKVVEIVFNQTAPKKRRFGDK